MSHTDRKSDILRFAAVARRAIDRGLIEDRAGTGVFKGERAKDFGLIDYLSQGGPTLPEPRRAERLKDVYMSKAGDAQQRALRGKEVRPRTVSAIARVAAVSAVTLALIFGAGLASTYAMPGNPLYSVKRLIEKVHMLILPGGRASANADLSHANRRLDELMYVEDRGSLDWYFSLAQDAEARIEDAYKESSSLSRIDADMILSEARRSMTRLEALVIKASPGLKTGQREVLEQKMNRMRKQLGGSPGTVPGAPGEIVPTTPGGPNGERQNGEPGTNQTMPGVPDQQPSQQQQ
ncbi:MAG: DUF5667 domain-containing protein [Actinobacteria bacterium]|jgi:hypothetical protein|nr:DUF5667 domain-containing protein [Actinomycetota bacterium]